MRRTAITLLVLLGIGTILPETADARPRRRAGVSRAYRPAAPARRVVRRHARPHYAYRGGVWVAVPGPVYVAPAYPAPVYAEPVYVAPQRAPEERMVRQRQPARPRPVGLLLRLDALGYTGEDSTGSSGDLSLGGLGAAMRLNLDPYWALELGVQSARGTDNELGLRRSTTPVTASLVVNLLPRSALNIYGLGGVGMQFTRAEALDYGYSERYNRPEFHVGGGLELRLSPAVRLFSDLRFIGLGAPSSTKVSLDASGATPPPWIAVQEGDGAVQFGAGIGVYF